MKSRRVLQIIVAVLSIATLACLALFAALLVVAIHVDVMPDQLVDFTLTFNRGMKSVADKFYLYDSVVPAVGLGVPALLLLIAVILLLVKGNGKDAKNIVGCAFALAGVLVLTLFLMVFANHLFEEEMLLAAFCASGGLLALFIIFVGCALGVKPKRIVITDDSQSLEQAEEVETTETEEVSEEAEAVSEEEPAEEAVEIEEEHFQFEEDEEAEETPTAREENKQLDDDTPATQYVPHLGVTIQEVVERTYGKEGVELSASTLQKINKVRALYEANAISEQEYIKLVNKYLGF